MDRGSDWSTPNSISYRGRRLHWCQQRNVQVVWVIIHLHSHSNNTSQANQHLCSQNGNPSHDNIQVWCYSLSSPCNFSTTFSIGDTNCKAAVCCPANTNIQRTVGLWCYVFFEFAYYVSGWVVLTYNVPGGGLRVRRSVCWCFFILVWVILGGYFIVSRENCNFCRWMVASRAKT